MYHEFIELPQQQRLNKKLYELITSYNQQEQKSQQQKGVSLLGLQCCQNINVEISVDNQRHSSKLFVLSNGKVLRYNYQVGEFNEIEGLEKINIEQIKVLEIGVQQRYVLMTDDGLYVCTIRQGQGDKVFQREQEEDRIRYPKKQEKQLCRRNDLMSQGQQERMKQQQQTENKLLPRLISCELQGSVFIGPTVQINNNNNNNDDVGQQNQQHQEQQQQLQQQQPLHQQQQENPLQSTKFRRMFILNSERNSHINHNDQNNNQLNTWEQEQHTVFIVIVNEAAWMSNYSIMLYQISVNYHNHNQTQIIQEQHYQQFQKTQQINPIETNKIELCYIKPLKLPNNQYIIQLILTTTDIQSAIRENRNINHVQLKNSNFMHKRTNPIIKIDHTISNHHTFSVYFATQSITDLFQPQDYRHKVFQFVLKVQKSNKAIIINQSNYHKNKMVQQKEIIEENKVKDKIKITAPIFQFPDKKVLFPQRVYHLPLVHDSAILSYFSLTKTFIKNNEYSPLLSSTPVSLMRHDDKQIQQKYDDQIEQQRIRLSGVIVSQMNKIGFMATEIKLRKQTMSLFSFQINEENLSLSTRINQQSFTLREVLLFDCVKQYAILLVSRQSINIYPDNKNQLQFLVMNLAPNTKNRVVVSRLLQDQFNDSICSLSLQIPQVNGIKMSHQLFSQSQNQLNIPKYIHLTNSKLTNKHITKTVKLLPKIILYQQILKNIIKHKQNPTSSPWNLLNINQQTFTLNLIKLLTL